MKRHNISIPKPQGNKQEQELLMWEIKLAAYGNNIESNRKDNIIEYSIDVNEEELNMVEFNIFKKALYRN